MMEIINIFNQNIFLFRALVACIAISFICPILGVFLSLRRMSLMGDAISHAILPGVAIGFMIGGMSIISMVLGGLIAGLLVTLLASLVTIKTNIKEDASFANFYLLAIALGVIIIATHGTNVDLIHILFGSILAINNMHLILIGIVVSISLIIISILIKLLIIDIFDKNQLKIYGINSLYLHFIFLFIVVVNLVVDFQLLGTILVVGLMMLPASIGRLLANSLNNIFLVAILSSLISSLFGILLSYYLDFPTGPAIILVCGIFYIFAILWKTLLNS